MPLLKFMVASGGGPDSPKSQDGSPRSVLDTAFAPGTLDDSPQNIRYAARSDAVPSTAPAGWFKMRRNDADAPSPDAAVAASSAGNLKAGWFRSRAADKSKTDKDLLQQSGTRSDGATPMNVISKAEATQAEVRLRSPLHRDDRGKPHGLARAAVGVNSGHQSTSRFSSPSRPTWSGSGPLETASGDLQAHSQEPALLPETRQGAKSMPFDSGPVTPIPVYRLDDRPIYRVEERNAFASPPPPGRRPALEGSSRNLMAAGRAAAAVNGTTMLPASSRQAEDSGRSPPGRTGAWWYGRHSGQNARPGAGPSRNVRGMYRPIIMSRGTALDVNMDAEVEVLVGGEAVHRNQRSKNEVVQQGHDAKTPQQAENRRGRKVDEAGRPGCEHEQDAGSPQVPHQVEDSAIFAAKRSTSVGGERPSFAENVRVLQVLQEGHAREMGQLREKMDRSTLRVKHSASKSLSCSSEDSFQSDGRQYLPKVLGHSGSVLQCASSASVSSEQSDGRSSGAQSESHGETSWSTEELPVLVGALSEGPVLFQLEALGTVRSITRNSQDARVRLGEAGAIPPLVSLMAVDDPRLLEACALATCNLLIGNKRNKSRLVEANGIPRLVALLASSSPSVREAATAAILTLAAEDDHKAAVGEAGAIPLLAQMLSCGSLQGRQDAAHALYNLVACDSNRTLVLEAKPIPGLLGVVQADPKSRASERAVAVIYTLTAVDEGRAALCEASNAVPALVAEIQWGSERGREVAISSLLAACVQSRRCCHVAVQMGTVTLLLELTPEPSARVKGKLRALLKCLERTGSAPVVMVTSCPGTPFVPGSPPGVPLKHAPTSPSSPQSELENVDFNSGNKIVREMVKESMRGAMRSIRMRANLPDS